METRSAKFALAISHIQFPDNYSFLIIIVGVPFLVPFWRPFGVLFWDPFGVPARVRFVTETQGKQSVLDIWGLQNDTIPVAFSVPFWVPFRDPFWCLLGACRPWGKIAIFSFQIIIVSI